MRKIEVKEAVGTYGTCLEATVTDDDLTLVFSQYPDEKSWYCDFCMHTKTSYVTFSHGTGSRCCQKHVARDGLAAEIDAVVTEEARRSLISAACEAQELFGPEGIDEIERGIESKRVAQ